MRSRGVSLLDVLVVLGAGAAALVTTMEQRARARVGASAAVAAVADSLVQARLTELAAHKSGAPHDGVAHAEQVYATVDGRALLFTRLTEIAEDGDARRIVVTVMRPTLPRPAADSLVVPSPAPSALE